MTMQTGKKRLFLIDGAALAYRSYFAFSRNPLVNSRGENVSVIFGLSNILLNLLDQEKPDYFAVVFDSPEPTFRHQLYEEYKAQRKEMPQEMVEQLPRMQQLFKALDFPFIRLSGYEADDIMGTLAKQAAREGLLTVLVTGDKDLMQLVDENTVIYYPHRGGEGVEWYDAAGVEQKMLVTPAQIIDYLALCGDSSDNIPGVPGIGPVGALALLKEYGSLDAVIANTESIKSKKYRAALEAHPELARMSQKLATIHCTVPLNIPLSELVIRPLPAERARSFFKEMELNTLVERFSQRQPLKTDYRLVRTADRFVEFLRQLKTAGEFAFDTETTGIDPMTAELVGMSFSWKESQAWYLPFKAAQDFASSSPVLDPAEALPLLRPILTDPAIQKIGHNAKYDLIIMSQHGIEMAGFTGDTMVASYLINPSGFQHNLDAASLTYLNLKKIPTSQLLGSGKNQKTMDQVPAEEVAEYACEDADFTLRLSRVLAPRLQELNLEKLYDEVELPLIYVLKRMEQNGVALDELYLAQMSRELDDELVQIEKIIYDLAGVKFNINSTKQLGTVLFETLKLPTSRKTKTGFSTDVSVLEELAKQHELPRQILEYRQLAKLKSTYVDALPRLINPRTGRVHTSYNQTVTATGRLSSSDPNLQNIPIRTEVGRRIRRAFIPGQAGWVILDADYSQIELRIMAHLSGDPLLRQSFARGEDVHTRTAALVFKVDPSEVTAEMRRKAKEVNFGIMYGMGVYGLSQRLGISLDEADGFIQSYFASYPGVQEYMLKTVSEARQNGYVTTLLQRRRLLPEISSDNRRMRDFAERTAINTPIQGTAADLIKVAMIHIQRRLELEKLTAMMIMQVHDELVFEVPLGEVERLRRLVQEEMEGAIQMEVPIVVEVGVGESWLEAH